MCHGVGQCAACKEQVKGDRREWQDGVYRTRENVALRVYKQAQAEQWGDLQHRLSANRSQVNSLVTG